MNTGTAVGLQQYELVGLVMVGVIALLPFAAGLLGIGLWVGGVARTATSAQSEAAGLRDRLQDLSNTFAAYQLAASREFVSQAAIDKLETRLMSGIADLGKRLDQVLHHPPPN